MRSRTRLTTDGVTRKVCPHGAECYRRNPKHLEEFVHPADECYLHLCREEGKEPQFVSIRKLFEWCDVSCSGTATRDEVTKIWPHIQALGSDVPPMDESLWQSIDDDGNGNMNFSEFAEMTTKFNVRLPLGLDDLLCRETNGDEQFVCGVMGCDCENFRPQRCKCKYGADCYQKKEEHLAKFAHPGDPDWEVAASSSSRADLEMCVCKHKRKLHASGRTGVDAVNYPDYWHAKVSGDEINARFACIPDILRRLQQLLVETYSDVTTRDRVTHCRTWEVPRNFSLVSAERNENSRLWRKYAIKKATLQKERRDAMDCGAAYDTFDDILTSRVWESMEGDRLDTGINEWYLFHGTSASAARNICSTDFKMRLAGSATGTLYGKGSYLAESITKADEYSKEEDGIFTLLLCRVLGGNVLYNAERTPDAQKLTDACLEGENDSILGDRKKVSGTYREFIIFDTENVYPEYVIKYRRGEFFKSPSHP